MEATVTTLRDACAVVDVLGEEVKSSLLQWFVDMQVGQQPLLSSVLSLCVSAWWADGRLRLSF